MKKCFEDFSNIVHERIEVVFDENQKECKKNRFDEERMVTSPDTLEKVNMVLSESVFLTVLFKDQICFRQFLGTEWIDICSMLCEESAR